MAAPKAHTRLSETVYERLKQDIFEFRLLPGDRLTETELADTLKVSRTPVRQALHRLEQEGYLKLAFRNGWNVLPFDFDRFEQLYDLRIIIELAAIQQICDAETAADLGELAAVWLVPASERLADARTVSENDEAFHQGLVLATGNGEMARVHRDISEKIRIIRRLDFTKGERINATYDEHAQILRLLTQRKAAQAAILMRSHISASKAEVRKITLHMLHVARQKAR
ncbi:MAG: GntR family transcriptional regulator [Sulfuritalea sp.]|nr:GntR family transcriptional regulator [Sulfuritalea sp.]MDP1984162.1 GntR family transcriptional regulator [Sulfuritalea sp.]